MYFSILLCAFITNKKGMNIMKDFLEFTPQNEDIDLKRIERLQKRMANRVASICSERAIFYTESFKQTNKGTSLYS